jgi:hypothetical protein
VLRGGGEQAAATANQEGSGGLAFREVWAGRWAKAQGGGRPPKRRRGETGRERVAAQREGRRERAGLEGKEARNLLG